MASYEFGQPSHRRYAPPAPSDILPVVGISFPLILLTAAMVWTISRGGFSWLSVVVGVAVGLLLAVDRDSGGRAISLLIGREDESRGGPRFARSPKLSPSLVMAGLVMAGALWAGGSEAAWIATITAGIIIASWAFVVAGGTALVNREVRSPMVTLGSGERGRALVVYHSARGGLMRRLQEAFAEGMSVEGWQVDLSTASSSSPSDLSKYQLLVLGSPCYYDGLARPIRAYFARIKNLRGTPVVTVVSGFGNTAGAAKALRELVRQAHGEVVDEIELWTKRPNLPRYGTTDPVEIMRTAGARIGRRSSAAA
jgi:hypothetical protein